MLIQCTAMSAQHGNGVTGFATCNALGQNGVTGGRDGETVHVSTRQELAQYASSPTPYTIIIDKDIEGGGVKDLQDELSINSNKTIIGSGSGKALNGVALIASGKRNIIIRNISLKKGRIDGVAFHNCHHVWIDHCDLSDSYDGLLDITNGSDFFTISWVKLHDHNKVSITNSGTCHYEDYNKERVTFAHCMFKDNVQRNPRIGYGKMHIYNTYWEGISSYCIGFHSQAQVLSENNYFSSSAKNPFCNQYSDKLPYCGYLTDKGSYFANGNPGTSYQHPFTDISYSPEEYYLYRFDITDANSVVTKTPTGVGPRDGIQYEPILHPGNGAIDVETSAQLSWGEIEGATTKMFFGTAADNMVECRAEDVRLSPATQYFWRVVATVGGKEYSSPTYTFLTAGEKASKPYPEDNATLPWLRYPTDGRTFCTAMPLTWRNAADAKAYRVYLAEEGEDIEKGFCGETTELSLVPGDLLTGRKYLWRVDAVKGDGTTVCGDVWKFSTSEKLWTAGKNEAEKMYVSGIAFREQNSTSSSRMNTVGDQGPGAVCGVWGGAEGRYAIETAAFNQTLGPSLYGVSVNGKLIDAWLSSDEDNNLSIRKTRNTVMLKPGDDIRIDFVAGLVDGGINQSRARIDYVNIIAAEGETVETERKNGIFHSPLYTAGYDCEYLPIRNVIFKDTLATVGEKDHIQVRDRYASWISLLSETYTLYLKQTAMVKVVYLSEGGEETVTSFEIDKDAQQTLSIPATHNGSTLFALHLYKTLPLKTVYYAPTAEAGKDHELIWSADVVYKDVNGEKGNPGKVQISKAYEEWVKYYNPTANEVQAKENIAAYIQPLTDKESPGFVPKGKGGGTLAFVVGTAKYATYNIVGCSRIRIYYTGTGGASTAMYFTIVDLDTEEQATYEGDAAPGKNVASAVFEQPLESTHRYAVKMAGSTGDMLVYAVKLWPGETSGITTVNADDDAPQAYNISGQRVHPDTKGIVILRNGKKTFVK